MPFLAGFGPKVDRPLPGGPLPSAPLALPGIEADDHAERSLRERDRIDRRLANPRALEQFADQSIDGADNVFAFEFHADLRGS